MLCQTQLSYPLLEEFRGVAAWRHMPQLFAPGGPVVNCVGPEDEFMFFGRSHLVTSQHPLSATFVVNDEW